MDIHIWKRHRETPHLILGITHLIHLAWGITPTLSTLLWASPCFGNPQGNTHRKVARYQYSLQFFASLFQQRLATSEMSEDPQEHLWPVRVRSGSACPLPGCPVAPLVFPSLFGWEEFRFELNQPKKDDLSFPMAAGHLSLCDGFGGGALLQNQPSVAQRRPWDFSFPFWSLCSHALQGSPLYFCILCATESHQKTGMPYVFQGHQNTL